MCNLLKNVKGDVPGSLGSEGEGQAWASVGRARWSRPGDRRDILLPVLNGDKKLMVGVGIQLSW